MPHPHAVGEQHPLAGIGSCTRDADAGHGARVVLPHVLRPELRRAHDRADGSAAEALPHRGRDRVLRRVEADHASDAGRVPVGGRARAHHCRPRDLQRGDRPCAARVGRRARRRVHDVPRLPEPHALEEGARRLHLDPRGRVRRARCGVGARHDQGSRLPLRHEGRRHDLEERRRHPAEQGEDPRRVRGSRREGRAGVRARSHHRVGASRVDREHLDGGDRDGRAGDDRQPAGAEPDLHDGQLRAPAARSRSCASSPACAVSWRIRRARSSSARSRPTSWKACRCSSTSSRPTVPARGSPTRRSVRPTRVT